MKVRTRIILTIIVLIIVPVSFSGIISDLIYYRDQEDEVSSTTFAEVFYDSLYFSNNLVKAIRVQEDHGITEASIIDFMAAYREENFGRDYGYLIYKDNEIIHESENLINYQGDYFQDEGEEIDEWDVSYYDMSAVSFYYGDGVRGQVVLVFDIESFFVNMLVYWGMFISIGFAAFVLLMIGLMIWITRSISKPLRQLESATSAITLGQLEEEVTVDKRSKDFQSLANEIDVLRMSLKESLEAQQDLEDEKARIIANISHDIRTPLTAISGYAEGIKDGIAKDESTRAEYISVIETKVRVIENLVDDLKILTAMDSHSSKYDMVTFDIGEFIEDCTDDLKYDVMEVRGNLSSIVPKGKHPVIADPEKLRRVFMNIIGNAIKYRSKSPLEISIELTMDSEGYAIAVEDNGLGIPEKEISEVTKRFYRIDRSRNLNTAGSGLGLSICSEILEDHGGRLEPVYKRHGAIMVIHLPKAESR